MSETACVAPTHARATVIGLAPPNSTNVLAAIAGCATKILSIYSCTSSCSTVRNKRNKPKNEVYSVPS